MPHASSLTSRMTRSAGQSAPAFDAKSNSTARRVPSDLTLYPLPCAVPQATPSSRLPRNPYSSERGHTAQAMLATSGDKFSGCDLRQRKPRLVWSDGTVQSKSSVFWFSSAQMTLARLTPGRDGQLLRASRKVQAVELPFFEPRGDSLSGDAEGSRQSTQTTAFFVSAKYLLAFLFCVSITARLLATALTAVTAQITLAAIRSQPVTH